MESTDHSFWDVSLSTMWARKNFSSLSDFFEAARQLEFGKIELNHQVDSAMLAGIDLSQYSFSSVHEPCPADISVETLKEADWLISATNEDNRRQGVQAIRRSIDFANQLGVRAMVVHSGIVQIDMALENELRSLFEAGKRDSKEYELVRERLIRERADLAGPRLEAVKMSLLELVEYASQFNICLGLENRYHYMDIPTQDEMEDLLNLADPDQLGMVFDVGHAQAMDRLGFFPFEQWLKRYSSRIIGAHLHDVVGVNDHYAPGLGEVDFRLVAKYLPEHAFRTCEVQVRNTAEQIRAGLRYLAECGCINNHT